MRKNQLTSWLTLFVIFTATAFAQQETIYMSILSSKKYRLNVSDNPLVGLFASWILIQILSL